MGTYYLFRDALCSLSAKCWWLSLQWDMVHPHSLRSYNAYFEYGAMIVWIPSCLFMSNLIMLLTTGPWKYNHSDFMTLCASDSEALCSRSLNISAHSLVSQQSDYRHIRRPGDKHENNVIWVRIICFVMHCVHYPQSVDDFLCSGTWCIPTA